MIFTILRNASKRMMHHDKLGSRPTNRSGKCKQILYTYSVHNHMKTFNSEQVTHHHGRTRIDQNAKLFENTAKIDEFIRKQTQLFQKQSAKWQPRLSHYLGRVNERRDERTSSTTEIYNGYQYYTIAAWHQDRQYTQIWRRAVDNGQGRTKIKEELVLDIMKYGLIKKHYKTVQLLRTVFSPCNKYVAFGFDLHNNEQISFMIKNIGKDHIVGIKDWEQNRLKCIDNIVFCGNDEILYTKVTNYRPNQLWHQNMKTGATRLIYTQANGQYYLDIAMAKDNKHVILNSNSKQNSKTWTIDTTALAVMDPSEKQLINSHKVMKQLSLNSSKNGDKKTKTYVNHNGKNFVVWRDSQQSSQILLLELKQKANAYKEKMLLRILPGQNETITDIDIFENYIVVYMRRIVSPIIRIINLQVKQNDAFKIQEVKLPYQFGSVRPGANQMLVASQFLFYINNIFVYDEGYQYSFNTGRITIREQFKMTGPKFNVNDYIVNLHQVPAEDGELVPLTTIVPRKQSKSRNKMLLHCYGHYGLAYEISFNTTYWAALQNGWSLAYAHVRGGNQKGISWHKQAIKGEKYKNWRDLEDCVAYLIRNQYTHPNILILCSHSAGSITIWNTINRFPHLYKGVIMSYPFLDVLGSLLDSSKPLTQSDYAQFGNPCQSLKVYNQIESYSPYQNIQHNKQYPFIYLVAGTNDYRCPLDQIAKFVKRFRQIRKWKGNRQRFQQIGQKGLLVKINEGSHQGIANLSDQIKDGCQTLACMDFLVQQASLDVSMKK